MGRHLPRDIAVAHLDALAAATGITADDATALVDRYPGARGVRRARSALALMDGGAQSPGETRLRLWLIDAGLPHPRTQIRVSDGFSEAFIDMGYDEPRVGFDYEGAHHSENRRQYVYDLGRADLIDREGWIDIRVVKEHTRRYVVHRAWEGAEDHTSSSSSMTGIGAVGTSATTILAAESAGMTSRCRAASAALVPTSRPARSLSSHRTSSRSQ